MTTFSDDSDNRGANVSRILQADFQPTFWAAGPHVQSVLSSAQPRRWLIRRATRDFRAASEDLLIDGGEGVRLLGHFNAAQGKPNGRLVVVLHGWEGSSDSIYNLTVGPQLNRHGFDTVRLNLRDHGESHHLNEELFHSCRLNEVVGAFQWIAGRFPDRRISAVGFSLGGNFVLRVANRARSAGFDLEQVVAICPVLDPVQTMRALDQGPAIYERYFIHKWRRSLMKKRAAFPHIYHFNELASLKSLVHMTDHFVVNYTEYDDLQTYLKGYAITEGRLDDIDIPTTVLMADDDPVIPISGLQNMRWPAAVELYRSPTGGHCGFLQGAKLQTWLDQFVLRQLTRQSAS